MNEMRTVKKYNKEREKKGVKKGRLETCTLMGMASAGATSRDRGTERDDGYRHLCRPLWERQEWKRVDLSVQRKRGQEGERREKNDR
jgi:hypothetical protein